jgi:elongator complex protein 1
MMDHLPGDYLTPDREEDVSKTMYRETLKVVPAEKHLYEPEASKGSNRSKVNRICDAFLEVLESRGSGYIQNIITSHVCKAPPDLDAGLAEIGKIRSRSSLCYTVHELSLPFLPANISLHLL